MPQNQKKKMRAEMRRILANLDERWASVAHGEVSNHLDRFIKAEVAGPRNKFLVWVPSFHGEVDLSTFIASMLRTGEVYLPRITGPNSMEFLNINEEWALNLEKSEKGVLQPKEGSGAILVPDGGDGVVILVPGLAFDKEGRRLGRGGGYYDRFLAREDMAAAVRIGVCWSVQVVPDIPIDDFDMSMDWVCHERGFLES